MVFVTIRTLLTLGITVCCAHSVPKFSTSFLRLLVAASLMANTWSMSHVMQRLFSFSSKKSTPSWPASSGMYSMMASRTRHFVSSASSTMAGSRD